MATRRGSVSARAETRRIAHVRECFTDLSRLPVTLRLGSFHAEFVFWGHINRTWWRNYEHSHSFFEVCYCYDGAGTFTINGVKHDISHGDVFIARPGQVHEIVAAKRNPMCILFWGCTLIRDSQAGLSDRGLDAILEDFSESPLFVKPCGHLLDATLNALCIEVQQRAAGFGTVIRGLAEKLIIDVARAFSTQTLRSEELPGHSARSGPAALNEAIRYLMDNLARPLEVSAVADHVIISERHLARLFRQHKSQSILDFITTERIKLASQLLIEKKLSIKEVSRAVGYPDPHYFTTLFGRRTGMTPSQFRQSSGTSYLPVKSK